MAAVVHKISVAKQTKSKAREWMLLLLIFSLSPFLFWNHSLLFFSAHLRFFPLESSMSHTASRPELAVLPGPEWQLKERGRFGEELSLKPTTIYFGALVGGGVYRLYSRYLPMYKRCVCVCCHFTAVCPSAGVYHHHFILVFLASSSWSTRVTFAKCQYWLTDWLKLKLTDATDAADD